MSPQSPLTWSSHADGTSSRRLDTLEMFFKTLADSGAPINREHWLMTFPMRLSFPDWVEDPAPYLRATWRDLRRLHPGLAGSPCRYMRTTASYAQHPLTKNYGAILAIDLRRSLQELYCLEEYAVGMFASGIPVVVENAVGKSFEGIVADLDRGYRRDVTRLYEDEEGRPVGLQRLTAPYIRRTMELFASPPPPGMPPSQNPGLSSLGRLDKFLASERPIGSGGSLGRLVLEDMGIGIGALGRALECHSWTFNGRLTLSASYNASFYEVEFVEEVLGKVRCELLAGLGLVEKVIAKL